MVLQKLATDDYVTESDDEVVAMWERNQMECHDQAIDQAYMEAIHETERMSHEDSKEANQVMDDHAMEIHWYQEMDDQEMDDQQMDDQEMEAEPDPWPTYWAHHPRPLRDAPWNQDPDAPPSSTIPKAGAKGSSTSAIPKGVAKPAALGSTSKACAPKVGAKGRACAPKVGAKGRGAIPADPAQPAAPMPKAAAPKGSMPPPEPAIPPRTPRPAAATRPESRRNYQTGWGAKMVWLLAMYENHDWEAMEAQAPVLWNQLQQSHSTGKWANKANQWLQAHHRYALVEEFAAVFAKTPPGTVPSLNRYPANPAELGKKWLDKVYGADEPAMVSIGGGWKSMVT
eukprot:s1280_g1.t1